MKNKNKGVMVIILLMLLTLLFISGCEFLVDDDIMAAVNK
jgi:hypothetical protein